MSVCIKWSNEEDKLLKDNYQLKKKDLIKLFPKRTAAAINIRASQLKLRKERNEYVENSCDILLEDSNLAYYWVGFILADGHIEDNKRLIITLSSKDILHLKKLALLLQCNLSNKIKSKCSISPQDKFVFSKLSNKFDIHHAKTYNPPSTNIIPDNEDLFLSLFAGFIDGDGSIKNQTGRKDCVIDLHIHSSWLKFIFIIHKRLNELFDVNIAPPRVGNDGYTRWTICNRKVVNGLKQKLSKLNIPLLERKWSKIDLGLPYDAQKASYRC